VLFVVVYFFVLCCLLVCKQISGNRACCSTVGAHTHRDTNMRTSVFHIFLETCCIEHFRTLGHLTLMS